MRRRLPLFVLLGAVCGAASVAAQSTPDRILYGPCTHTDIVELDDATYSAAVGVMSVDPTSRAKLLAGVPGRRNAGSCAFVVSESFCNAEFLSFASSALTSSMTAGGAGSRFFTALGLNEAASDPAANALGLTMGLGGAILGGIVGSEDGAIGMAKGGAIGGALGLGAGAIARNKMLLDRCRGVQNQFSDLTARMIGSGLRPQRNYPQLFGEIRRVTARMHAKDKELAETMIEAMAVSAAKIKTVR